MSGPFEVMRDVLLTSPMSIAVIYIDSLGQLHEGLRALVATRQPVEPLGRGRATQDKLDLELSTDDLADCRRDDQIQVGDVLYVVRETPVRDRHGLFWQIVAVRDQNVVTGQ